MAYPPSALTPPPAAAEVTPPHSPAGSMLSSPPTPAHEPLPAQLASPATVHPPAASDTHVTAARAAASEALLSHGTAATFSLAAALVRAAPLEPAPRRGDRVLPGRADTSVAAAYMLGGTPDAALGALLQRWDVCAPRALKVKAAERMYKERVKALIGILNVGVRREGRAENLAALRVCEVIADIVDGYVVREMVGGMQAKDQAIAELQGRLAELQRASQVRESHAHVSAMRLC